MYTTVNFLDRYQKAKQEKNSLLCVALDASLKSMKRPLDMNERDVNELFFNFCMNLIEETADYACAIKQNSQFTLFTFSFDQIRELNKTAHKYGLISVCDHKLGDIGSSNSSAFYWISRAGFDALTFSPFAGNIKEATEDAHGNSLGLICLTLMSNPEAAWIQKNSFFEGKPLYEKIAYEVRKNSADGCVVGTTGHVTTDDIGRIRSIVGKEKIFLCPGLGAQGGDVRKVIEFGGDNLLIVVARAIAYAENPGKAARSFNELINSCRL